jgi:hypothetical protein
MFVSVFYGCIALSSTAFATTSIPEKETSISYDWLDVTVHDNDQNDELKFYSGGYDMINAENLGSLNHGNGQYTFRYKATFGFEIYAYTSATIRDIWENMNVDAQQRYEFLKVKVYGAGLDRVGTWGPYHVSFDHVELGNINRHHYDVDVPIEVGLNPDFYNFAGETLGDIEIAGSDYVWKPKTLEVQNTETGKIGEYKDILTSQPTQEEQYVDIGRDHIGTNEETGKSKLQDWIASKNLGAYVVESNTYVEQSWIKDPGKPAGSVMTNTQTGSTTFNDYIELRPEVTVTRNKVKKRAVSAKYNNFYDNYWGANVVEQSSGEEGMPYVTQKTHAQNYYIHKEYTTNIVFECNVEIANYEESESLLEKPAFEQGDWIWTAERGGTEELTLVSEPSAGTQIGEAIGRAIGGFFEGIFGGLFSGTAGFVLLIIIILSVIIGIYLFIKVGLPLIRGYSGAPSRSDKLDSN